MVIIAGSAFIGMRFYDPVPDFHKMTDVEVKKSVFLNYLKPAVKAGNDRIRRQRRALLGVQQRHATGSLTASDRRLVRTLATEYEVEVTEPLVAGDIEQLLRRVDTVPLSLALAQAAKESGWGTSRFAQEYNNFFGVWCFEKGCGVVPDERARGRRHEVADFTSVHHSVTYYLKNLNTHEAYRDLRRLREQLRSTGEPLSGEHLAQGLARYSERGAVYVDEVVSMIRYNELDRL
ncbi:MAG: glucosaminidase domain-containing protein [Pseudomonadales bacterium]